MQRLTFNQIHTQEYALKTWQTDSRWKSTIVNFISETDQGFSLSITVSHYRSGIV